MLRFGVKLPFRRDFSNFPLWLPAGLAPTPLLACVAGAGGSAFRSSQTAASARIPLDREPGRALLALVVALAGTPRRLVFGFAAVAVGATVGVFQVGGWGRRLGHLPRFARCSTGGGLPSATLAMLRWAAADWHPDCPCYG